MNSLSQLFDKFKTYIHENIMDKEWEIKYKILTLISGGLVAIWYLGMMMQLLDIIVDKNYSIFMEYGMVTLTLFGFTLIGGIFEENNKQSLIKLKLFDSSLNFLITSIAFFVIYSISYFLSTNLDGMGAIIVIGAFFICIILSFLGLIMGIVELLKLLIDYRIKLKKTVKT